jgi:Transposase IS66 family
VEPRWAQVIDVEILRKVTEVLLPGLACGDCCTVTYAAAPPGFHPGSVSYGPMLNGAAVLLSCFGNVPAERSARLIGMLTGQEVSSGWAGKAVARIDAGLRAAGFDEAMLAALAAEGVLAADETPVSVTDKTPLPDPEPDGGAYPEEKAGNRRPRGTARADCRDPGRAADVPAGPGLAAEGQRRRRHPRRLRRLPDDRRLHRVPAPHRRFQHDAVKLIMACRACAERRRTMPDIAMPGKATTWPPEWPPGMFDTFDLCF